MKRIALGLAMAIALAAVGAAGCGSGRAEENTSKRVILTSGAPTPIGPYSQGILFGDALYCSGQVGIDPATGHLVPGGIEEETAQALRNLGAVLQAAGMDYVDATMVTIFLTNINDYAAVNTVYATFFTTAPPARQAVQVGALPAGASVEISLIAKKSSS